MATFTASLSIVKELRRLASIQTNRPYMLRNDVNSLLVFTDPDEQPHEVVSIHFNYFDSKLLNLLDLNSRNGLYMIQKFSLRDKVFCFCIAVPSS